MRVSVEKPPSGKRVHCKLYQFEEGKHVASDVITRVRGNSEAG
jgi:hypothetical protein